MKRKTTEEFRKEVETKTNGEYSLHSDSKYVNNKTKVNMIHNKCGKVYPVRPDVFINGKRCPFCSRKDDDETLLKKHNKLQKKLLKKGILLTSSYITCDDPIDFMCLRCGNTDTSTPYRLEHNNCAYCAGKKKYTTEDIRKMIPKIDSEYILHPDYQYHNKFEKLRLVHLICGSTYEVTLSNFRNRKNRCTYCKPNESRYLTQIKKALEEKNIKFDTEISFDDLSYKHKLRFDIKIDNLIIEYDGIQHFKRTNALFSPDNITRDFVKNIWIQSQNKYSFLRIPPNLEENDINVIIDAIINKKVTVELIKKYKLYAYNRKNQVLYNSHDYYTNINENYFEDYKELLKKFSNNNSLS